MTDFSSANYLSNSARTEAEMKAAFEANLAATKQLPGANAQSIISIVNDQITPTREAHLVDGQFALADNLAQILLTNLPDGSYLRLGIVSNSRPITIKQAQGGVGQISLVSGVDFLMDNTTMSLLLQRNGSVWEERDRAYGTAAAAHRTFYGTPALSVPNTFTQRQLWAKGADLPSGATLTPGVDGNYFHVTGTTTITAIAALQAGARILLEFDSTVQITHNATSLILPLGTNIVTAAGDMLEFVSEGSGIWRLNSASSVGGGGLDPKTFVSLHEDFSRLQSNNASTNVLVSGANVFPSGVWRAVGTTLTQTGLARGGLRLTNGVDLIGPIKALNDNTIHPIVVAADNPIVTMRLASVANAETFTSRWAGCAAATFNGADPSNGIYVRWDHNGTYRFQTRSGGVEQTTDTTVTANTTERVFKMVIASALVTLFVDGVQRAQHTTNIPSVGLALAASVTGQSDCNLDIKYFDVVFSR